MNTMTLERIEHKVAQDIAKKINIDWTNLVDFVDSLNEIKRQINDERMDEEEAREAFETYFSELADSLEWYAVQTDESDDAGTGSWDWDEALDMAREMISGLLQEGRDASGVIVTTWINNLTNPYCKETYRIGQEEDNAE